MFEGIRGETRDKYLFINKIAELVSVGIPVRNALRGIAQTEHGRMSKAASSILESLTTGGKTIKDAIGGVFELNQIEESILHSAGVSNLSESLSTISQYYKDLEEFKRDIMSTLVRPVGQLILSLVVLSIIAFVVAPKISQTVPGMKSGMSSIMGTIRSAIMVLFAITGLFGVLMAYLRLSDRYMYSKMLSHIPVFGSIKKYRDMYVFLKVVSLLTRGGVGVVPAINVANQATPVYLRHEIDNGIKAMREKGIRLKEAIGSIQLFPFYVVDLIDTAEKSGNYPRFLADAAELMRRDFHTKRSALLPIIEFSSLGMVAFVVVIAFFSLFSPLQNMGAFVK